jgi:hypothetical protein
VGGGERWWRRHTLSDGKKRTGPPDTKCESRDEKWVITVMSERRRYH